MPPACRTLDPRGQGLPPGCVTRAFYPVRDPTPWMGVAPSRPPLSVSAGLLDSVPWSPARDALPIEECAHDGRWRPKRSERRADPGPSKPLGQRLPGIPALGFVSST